MSDVRTASLMNVKQRILYKKLSSINKKLSSMNKKPCLVTTWRGVFSSSMKESSQVTDSTISSLTSQRIQFELCLVTTWRGITKIG